MGIVAAIFLGNASGANHNFVEGPTHLPTVSVIVVARLLATVALDLKTSARTLVPAAAATCPSPRALVTNFVNIMAIAAMTTFSSVPCPFSKTAASPAPNPQTLKRRLLPPPAIPLHGRFRNLPKRTRPVHAERSKMLQCRRRSQRLRLRTLKGRLLDLRAEQHHELCLQAGPARAGAPGARARNRLLGPLELQPIAPRWLPEAEMAEMGEMAIDRGLCLKLKSELNIFSLVSCIEDII